MWNSSVGLISDFECVYCKTDRCLFLVSHVGEVLLGSCKFLSKLSSVACRTVNDDLLQYICRCLTQIEERANDHGLDHAAQRFHLCICFVPLTL